MVVNSCNTWSIRTEVTAAPGIDDSRVRRNELPRVYPNPGSSGSRTNRERVSDTGSSVNVGRCAMSTDISFRRDPPFDTRSWGKRWNYLWGIPQPVANMAVDRGCGVLKSLRRDDVWPGVHRCGQLE